MNASSDVLIRKNVSVSFTSPTPYDEEIVPEFKKMLKDKAPWKFIVLHLAGMHPTYKFRYPGQFDIYNDTLKNLNELSMNEVSKINQYNNAMTCNSYFIRTILDELEKENTVSYLLVTSDHAQELGQSDESIVEHKPTGGSQFQYNIPFFLWLSPEYKNRHSEFVSYINTTLHRFWRTDAIQYLIADLSRIEFDKNKKSKSIFSNQYIYPGTMINGGTTDYAKLFGGADCSQ